MVLVGGKCIVEKEKMRYQDSHIYSYSFYRRRKYAMRIHRHAFQLIRMIEPWKIVFRWLIVDHVPCTTTHRLSYLIYSFPFHIPKYLGVYSRLIVIVLRISCFAQYFANSIDATNHENKEVQSHWSRMLITSTLK